MNTTTKRSTTSKHWSKQQVNTGPNYRRYIHSPADLQVGPVLFLTGLFVGEEKLSLHICAQFLCLFFFIHKELDDMTD